jgi:transposase
MKTSKRYSPEVRERAVRMVLDQRSEHNSQWATVESISSKIGCTSETLRRWIQQTERDQGERAGMTTDDKARLKQLERENRELKRANEILRKASAFFAQAELDRPLKKW